MEEKKDSYFSGFWYVWMFVSFGKFKIYKIFNL